MKDSTLCQKVAATRRPKFRGWPGKEYLNAHQAALDAAHILYLKVVSALCLSDKQHGYIYDLLTPTGDLSLADFRSQHKKMTWLTEKFRREQSRVVRVVLTLPNPREALDVACEEIERECDKAIGNLERLPDTQSQPLSSTNALRAKHQLLARETDRDTSNSFRRVGATWEVCFESERGSFPTASFSALTVVRELLAKPNHPVDLKELVGEEARQVLEHPASKEDVIDSPGIQDLQRRYQELQECRDDPNPLVRQEYKAEMASIAAELKRAIGPGGRKRQLGWSPQDQAWGALTKNLKRLYGRLEDNGMPKLAAHLKCSIQFARPTITYNPPTGTPSWHLEQ